MRDTKRARFRASTSATRLRTRPALARSSGLGMRSVCTICAHSKLGSTSPRACMIVTTETRVPTHAVPETQTRDGRRHEWQRLQLMATAADGDGSEHMKDTFRPNKNSTTMSQPGDRTQCQPL